MTGTTMHANEQPTDAALVRRLLAGQFPQWAGLPIERVASAGTDNALYRLGDEMAVRLPRIDWAVDDVDREQRWLPRLAPLMPVSIPLPLARGVPAEGYPWPWSVYRWLEGENPAVEGVTESGTLAGELARFIAALRAVDLAGGPPAGRGVPLAMRDRPTRAAIAALAGTVDTDAATETWEAVMRQPAWHGPPMWVHGDLAPGNLLLREGRLAAVIDWAGVGVGDPACDLMVAWNLLAPVDRGAFRDAVGMDDATWQRGRGWALSVALIQLPYYRDTNPVLAAGARHVLRQILSA